MGATEVVSAIAAVASAAAAGAAWRAAHKSNELASAVEGIEASRRHDELRPQISLTLEHPYQDQLRQAKLRLRLVGPANVNPVRVTVEILSDVPGDSKLAGAPPRDEVETHVWGPGAFQRNFDQAPNTRLSAPFELALGSYRLLELWESSQPPWDESDASYWAARVQDLPMMLLVAMKDSRDPGRLWVEYVEIPAPIFK